MRGWVPPAAAGALVGGALGAITSERPADVALFTRAGQDVLTGHFAAVYGSVDNQAGPLQMVLNRLLMTGAGPARPVLVVTDALIAALIAVLAHRAAGSRRAGLALGYTALWLIAPAFWGGHPVEALIPVLWLVAGRLDGRPAALALAGAAVVAPWGVLGWPVVLRRGRAGAAARTLLGAGALAAAVYVPLLLLAAHGSALHHVWPVDRRTLWHVVLPQVHGVGWPVRMVQATVVLALLAALAWRVPAAPWRAPLLVTAAGLLRVATDPLGYAYYWLPAGVGALALLITVPRLAGRAGAAVLALAYLAWSAASLHLAVAPLAGVAVLAAGFAPAGYGRQIRSSSARNRAAGSAVRGPSR